MGFNALLLAEALVAAAFEARRFDDRLTRFFFSA
jgi:hypothetical protein